MEIYYAGLLSEYEPFVFQRGKNVERKWEVWGECEREVCTGNDAFSKKNGERAGELKERVTKGTGER